MSTLTSAAYSSNITPAPGTTNQFRRAATALLSLRGFLANRQFVGLFVAASPFTGDTPDFFQTRVLDLQQRIDALQASAGVDDDGDATVHLHYFTSCTHWYITKRDTCVGGLHAYGYTIRGGKVVSGRPEYISIDAITICGAELDLDFKPCSSADLLTRHGYVYPNSAEPQKPWVLVENAGQADQLVTQDFGCFDEAVATMEMAGHGDIYKRLQDDTLVQIY